MLFNSYEFIFLYLPVVLVGFFVVAKRSRSLAALWLAAASIFFYAWWNPKFVALLLGSIVANYTASRLISQTHSGGRRQGLLAGAIGANLLLLGVFKYANFFIATANRAGAQLGLLEILLPLGISFFTFTQIAFLVDVHRGLAREASFLHYLLFVTWFPHLIAGPVLHHKQMMPQFALPATYRPNAESISVGLTLFSLGLFKKTVLADRFALYANPIFDAAAKGAPLMFAEAWAGALAYALQLYFDFSGYSDMAIGLSRLFNIKLPLNFNSPYKAASIVEFWRRWHMTLSGFLRDYLYIPLGGNRKGPVRRQVNVMVTMLLGGLWHGAGWNFVLWGGLHGLYLVANHGWRKIAGGTSGACGPFSQRAGVLLTFTAVVVAWVPFRAATLGATLTMLEGMVGMNGSGGSPVTDLPVVLVPLWLSIGLLIVWLLPNTQEWLVNFAPAWDEVTSRSRLAWRPTRRHAVIVGVLLAVALLSVNHASEFLYYRF